MFKRFSLFALFLMALVAVVPAFSQEEAVDYERRFDRHDKSARNSRMHRA